MLGVLTYCYNKTLPLPGTPERMMFRNCTMEGMDRVLLYNASGSDPWQSGNPLRDVHFENVEMSGIRDGLVAYGTEDVPLTLTMTNVTFRFREGREDQPLLRAGHCKRIALKNVSLPNAKGPLVKTWTACGIEFDHVAAAVPENRRVVAAEEPFHVDCI